MNFFVGDIVTRLSSKTDLIKYGSIQVNGVNVDNENKRHIVKWHPDGVVEDILENEVYLPNDY